MLIVSDKMKEGLKTKLTIAIVLMAIGFASPPNNLMLKHSA